MFQTMVIQTKVVVTVDCLVKDEPNKGQDNTMNIRNLHDLYLLSSEINVHTIFPCLCLITDCGYTTFLYDIRGGTRCGGPGPSLKRKK